MKVLCISLCVAFASGFYIDNDGTHEEKIVGGDPVRIEDLPYQATLLWMRIDNVCGATIIHESWVITAAHCVENKSHISVRTGSRYRRSFGKEHRVEQIIMHEDFETDSKNNDIALIKLVEPIQLNNGQKPIQIAKPHDIPREGELMRISGFGRIGEHLRKSDVLMAAYVPVMNQENCERAYSSHPITHNMFCAGNGDADACYGDSGGPGVIHGKLYGIISTGTNCGSRIFPGVYTRTYFILYDFIDYFEKDNPSALDRSKFLQIINTIFKNMSKIEREAIAFQYTDWENTNDEYMYQRMVADIVGDYFFICPSIHFAQLFADRGMDVYYYFFTQKSSTNLWGDWMGVMHGDEIEYVFGHPLNESLKYTERERKLAYKMIMAYSTFAEHGKPMREDGKWLAYTRDQPNYYIFNAEKNGMGKGPRTTACAFWNEFLPRLKGVPDPSPEACSGAVASSVSAGAWGVRSTASCVTLILGPLLLLRAQRPAQII